MANVIVVGDGPGGLSAALFLAKNDVDVTVYGQDKTAMHAAQLKNYLGIEDMHGSAFQELARGQVTGFGASVEDARVESVARAEGGGFTLTLEGGETRTASYLVLSEGKSPRLATMLGLTHDASSGIETDDYGLTSVEGLYVVGRLRRPGRSQAIISAGDGAAAAIDILSREKGASFMDWDVPGDS